MAVHTGDLVGKTFTRWTVVAFSRKSNPMKANSTTLWHCRCACGTEKEVSRDSLRKGRSKSCGCLKREMMTTHGCSLTSALYATWYNMVQRCNSPQNPAYPNYGGRGITVCPTWLGPDGLKQFLSDMGEKPKGLTLDRVDNDMGYSKANCRWATYSEQNRNKRPRKIGS